MGSRVDSSSESFIAGHRFYKNIPYVLFRTTILNSLWFRKKVIAIYEKKGNIAGQTQTIGRIFHMSDLPSHRYLYRRSIKYMVGRWSRHCSNHDVGWILANSLEYLGSESYSPVVKVGLAMLTSKGFQSVFSKLVLALKILRILKRRGGIPQQPAAPKRNDIMISVNCLPQMAYLR